jgi:hypothetical protein
VGWTKKSEKKEANGFVEVKMKTSSIVLSSEILVEKGNVKIHIPLTLGYNELRAVMESLGGVL